MVESGTTWDGSFEITESGQGSSGNMMTRPAEILMRCATLTFLFTDPFVSLGLAAETTVTPSNRENSQAVEDVLSGRRTDANAAWWGFNTEEATESTSTEEANVDSAKT